MDDAGLAEKEASMNDYAGKTYLESPPAEAPWWLQLGVLALGAAVLLAPVWMN